MTKSVQLTHSKTNYPKSVQQLLNWYAFFLAFPVVDILGLSITFYIFGFIFLLQNQAGIAFIRKGKGNWIFWLFLLSAAVSTIFHPPLMEAVSPFATARNTIQIAYWLVLALYIKSNYHLINWYLFSKYLFWGLVLLVIAFYLLPINLSAGFININIRQSRNGFVFNMLTFFPFIFFYVRNSYWRKHTILILFYFASAMLLSNGRSGFILILIQTILILPAIYKRMAGMFRLSLVLVILLIAAWITLEDSPLMNDIAEVVETVNPRAASLISKSGTEGDLTQDKSWLIRKLMVDKSLEIAGKYPLMGIGWFNFTNYATDLRSLNKYDRLQGQSDGFYNTRSAHNSYAQLLGEGGIIGLLLLLLILLPTASVVLKRIALGGFKMNDLPLIAMFTLFIYFYAISSLTGAGTWLIIGASYAFATKTKSS